MLANLVLVDHLPLVMLGLYTTPHDKTRFSASEAVYGAPLCLPGEFLLICLSESSWTEFNLPFVV